MTTYFSATTFGFYNDAFKDTYVKAGTWPADAKEVSEEELSTYTSTPADGKQLGADTSGSPAWVDTPPLSEAELIAAAKSEKNNKTDDANGYINSMQWPSKLALGRLSDSDKALFNEWLDYLDALNAVDTSTAPDITWPTEPGSSS
ncbi:tail fiber assembly protein [Mangrovibacter phragmitis]|uniref:tail fiber assembly protein n=1 Tax=Mangrovibacter phragmitis TaxID=1691903 RepID=UPI00336A8FBA